MSRARVDREYIEASRRFRRDFQEQVPFRVISPKDYGEEYLPKPRKRWFVAIGLAAYIALIIAGTAFLLDTLKIFPN